MEFPKSSRMEWVMKIRTTLWFRANLPHWFGAHLKIRRPPGFKIVGQLSFLKLINSNWNLIVSVPFWLNWQKSFDSNWNFHLLNWGWQQKAEAEGSTCSLVLVSRGNWRFEIVQHLNISRFLMWTGAMPCLLPHQKPWTCWGNQQIFRQCSTDSCQCFSTLALVPKEIICCSSMISKFLVGSLSTPIPSGWMLS